MFYSSLATCQMMMTVMIQHLMYQIFCESDMKSRNDLWELGLFFEKVT